MRHALRILLLASLALVASIPARAAGADGLWRDWNTGLREAGSSSKPVLVDVHTEWCGWCKRMNRDVYARKDVREYLQKHFVTISLDAEGGEAAQYEGKTFTSRSLAARFRVTGYPTTIFLAPDGAHLANVPGYIPAERFLLLLRYIGDGHLDRGVAFDDFVKSAGTPATARGR
jgi:thioredoxin-related protein